MMVLVLVVLGSLFFALMTFYYLFVGENDKSYGSPRWREYFSVEDWNLPKHAITDIDGDGRNDLVTFTNCAFLSSIGAEKISKDRQCQEPEMAPLVFAGGEKMIGQALVSRRLFGYDWLKKSHLVKTENGKWRFYEINGWQVRAFEMKDDGLFEEIEPSLTDKTDAAFYQIKHLGVMLLFIIKG